MRTEILTTGDEILTGKIADANANLIIRQLLGAGIPVKKITSCGDDPDELIQAINAATANADLLIVTGGLGPTDDDRTAQAAARIFNRPLRLDQPTLDWLNDLFKNFNIPFTENNRKQAMFPEGSTILDNPMGTARGFAIATDRLAIFLPGPPREVGPMMEQVVLPLIRKQLKLDMLVRPLVFKTFGLTESQLDQVLTEKPFDEPGCTIGIRATFPEIHVHVTIEAESEDHADRLAEKADRWITERLGDLVFSTDPQIGLAEVVVRLLTEAGQTLALAESCTGGLIAQLITGVSGASEVLDNCAVTYSNRAKIRMLGVDPRTIEEHGAVSESCALQMATGARWAAGADLSLAVTGIAGPTGGSAEKPVGTVYIAVDDGKNPSCRRFNFRWTREWIRSLTAYAALDAIRHLLQKGEPWDRSAYLSRWQSGRK